MVTAPPPLPATQPPSTQPPWGARPPPRPSPRATPPRATPLPPSPPAAAALLPGSVGPFAGDEHPPVLENVLCHISYSCTHGRDILAIPASTVASESAFSGGEKIINEYRSRLSSDTVEALVCLQDWLRERNGLDSSNHDDIAGCIMGDEEDDEL